MGNTLATRCRGVLLLVGDVGRWGIMITSCNHSSTEKLCGSCREKNYRQSFLDEKDARIAELERQLAELRDAAKPFVIAYAKHREDYERITGKSHPCRDDSIVWEMDHIIKVTSGDFNRLERLLEGK